MGKNLKDILIHGDHAGFSLGPNVSIRPGTEMEGVDKRLIDILSQASGSLPAGYTLEFTSGKNARGTGTKLHPGGIAMDVQIIDANGNALPNYASPEHFRIYEQFAQAARQAQHASYPKLDNNFRWGGYFGKSHGNPKGADIMHFDVSGKGMAAGTWKGGLNEGYHYDLNKPGFRSAGIGKVKSTIEIPGQSPAPEATPAAAATPKSLITAVATPPPNQTDRQIGKAGIEPPRLKQPPWNPGVAQLEQAGFDGNPNWTYQPTPSSSPSPAPSPPPAPVSDWSLTPSTQISGGDIRNPIFQEPPSNPDASFSAPPLEPYVPPANVVVQGDANPNSPNGDSWGGFSFSNDFFTNPDNYPSEMFNHGVDPVSPFQVGGEIVDMSNVKHGPSVPNNSFNDFSTGGPSWNNPAMNENVQATGPDNIYSEPGSAGAGINYGPDSNNFIGADPTDQYPNVTGVPSLNDFANTDPSTWMSPDQVTHGSNIPNNSFNDFSTGGPSWNNPALNENVQPTGPSGYTDPGYTDAGSSSGGYYGPLSPDYSGYSTPASDYGAGAGDMSWMFNVDPGASFSPGQDTGGGGGYYGPMSPDYSGQGSTDANDYINAVNSSGDMSWMFDAGNIDTAAWDTSSNSGHGPGPYSPENGGYTGFSPGIDAPLADWQAANDTYGEGGWYYDSNENIVSNDAGPTPGAEADFFAANADASTDAWTPPPDQIDSGGGGGGGGGGSSASGQNNAPPPYNGIGSGQSGFNELGHGLATVSDFYSPPPGFTPGYDSAGNPGYWSDPEPGTGIVNWTPASNLNPGGSHYVNPGSPGGHYSASQPFGSQYNYGGTTGPRVAAAPTQFQVGSNIGVNPGGTSYYNALAGGGRGAQMAVNNKSRAQAQEQGFSGQGASTLIWHENPGHGNVGAWNAKHKQGSWERHPMTALFGGRPQFEAGGGKVNLYKDIWGSDYDPNSVVGSTGPSSSQATAAIHNGSFSIMQKNG